MKKIICLLTFLSIFFVSVAQDAKPVVKSIYFGGGSWYIDSEQLLELQEFIKSFAYIESYRISITSHTDNIGGEVYNQWLSKRRSGAVIEQLILNEVPRDIIYIEDHGQYNPLYDNKTLEGRLMNRRVDIIFSPLAL